HNQSDSPNESGVRVPDLRPRVDREVVRVDVAIVHVFGAGARREDLVTEHAAAEVQPEWRAAAEVTADESREVADGRDAERLRTRGALRRVRRDDIGSLHAEELVVRAPSDDDSAGKRYGGCGTYQSWANVHG